MSLNCLDRSQFEEAISVAKLALGEVEHVGQFQEPDDFQAHFDQLQAHREQVDIFERELGLHIQGCDLCAGEQPAS